MIFVNSPFAILDEAFRSLYQDKKYKACIEPSIKDDEGNRVFGFTQFSKGETPVIAISAELNIMDATEIFAHELAHVAAGEGAGHGERWDKEFQRIFDEYNRIGKGRFGEDGKEIETAPEYRGGWIRSEDRMPEEGEDVLVWFEYFRFGNYQELFQTVGISCTWRGSEDALHGISAIYEADRRRHRPVTATDNQLHDGDAERVTRSERKGRQIAETITHNRRKQSDKLKGGIDMALLNGFKETEAEQQYRRGEIYYINNASKEHIGSEMKKDRPAVIVSCDANNKHSDVLEVVFLTSAPKKDLPTHVTIRSTGRKSEALCEQPTPVSVERINNFVGKASEKEMEQIDIALLIGLGIKLAGAENQSGGASRKSEQQIQSSVKDRSKEESEKMAEENQMLREELKKQQESTIRSEAECSAYKAMHEQLLKKLMERRE